MDETGAEIEEVWLAGMRVTIKYSKCMTNDALLHFYKTWAKSNKIGVSHQKFMSFLNFTPHVKFSSIVIETWRVFWLVKQGILED